MSIAFESVERINALKNGIEAITGESYENLTAGVQALKNGYGQSEYINMSLAVNAQSMFYNAGLTFFPLINTGNIKSFRTAFYGCKFTEAELDLTSCADMRSAFYDCKLLTKLTLKNAQKINSTYWDTCFTGCSALTDFSIDCLNVTGNQIDFSTCTKLTVDSLMNILNALSDNTGVSTTYTVKLGATNLAKLTAEQKQIATNKNIALA